MIKEQDLLDRLKANQKSALNELYKVYWEHLFLSAYNLLKDKEACEEIVQDIFINIWERRQELQINTTFKGYLYGMVRYKVFNHIRTHTKEKAVKTISAAEKRFQYNSAESEILYQDYEKHLEQIISTLPEKCKTVYRLSRNEHLSHKEISKKLNISTKTVENHITKALHTIRKALKEIIALMALIFSF